MVPFAQLKGESHKGNWDPGIHTIRQCKATLFQLNEQPHK